MADIDLGKVMPPIVRGGRREAAAAGRFGLPAVRAVAGPSVWAATGSPGAHAETGAAAGASGAGTAGGASASWSPPIELLEAEGRLVVYAELPGVAVEDVSVEITDEGLVLEGEKKPDAEVRRSHVFRSERAYGSFRRTIPLPQGARVEEARARFDNGVLRVSVPVPEVTRRRRRVPVESAVSREGRGELAHDPASADPALEP